jgi:hypothetical protein
VPDVLSAIRPDDVNLPLFLHVLGAMLLVGTLLTSAVAIFAGRRAGERSNDLLRFGLRAVLWGVLPAYILMRVGAQWTEAAADYAEGFEATWIDIGYITADLGALLLLISIVLAAIGLRRLRSGGGPALARAVGVISLVLVAAYVVAVWAMTVKPV